MLPLSKPGTPRPDVKWSKDGIELNPSMDSRISLDFDGKTDLYVLTIKNTVMSDEGGYEFLVVNEQGMASVTVMVTAIATVKKEIHEKYTGESTEKPEKTTEKAPEIPEGREPCEPTIKVSPEPVFFDVGGIIALPCQVSG